MRFGHISDVHLLSLAGSRVLDFANKRIAGGVNLIVARGRHHKTEVFDALTADVAGQGLDHLVCTGDVTNLALESEFKFARAKFDALSLGPERITCIPGNHDTYVAEVAGLFEQTFAPYLAADEEWGWKDGGRWPIVRVRGDLALIGLSTSQPTAWFMAYGSVGDEQLGRLRRVLADPRLDGKFRVVLLHHPPAGRRAKSIRRGLRDHEAFAKVIADVGAELVLHGHEHVDVFETLPGPDGPVPVRGIHSATYIADTPKWRARWRIYTINRGGDGGGRPRLVAEELRTWRPAARAFEREAHSPAVEAAVSAT